MSRLKAARALRGLETPSEKMSRCLLGMMGQYLKPWQVRYMCRILEGQVIDRDVTLDVIMLATYDRDYLIKRQDRVDLFVDDYETAYRAYLADNPADNDRWTFFDDAIPSSDAEVKAALDDKFVEDRWRMSVGLGRAIILRNQKLAPYSPTMKRVGHKAVETNPTPPPPPKELPPTRKPLPLNEGLRIIEEGTTSDRTTPLPKYKWTTSNSTSDGWEEKKE